MKLKKLIAALATLDIFFPIQCFAYTNGVLPVGLGAKAGTAGGGAAIAIEPAGDVESNPAATAKLGNEVSLFFAMAYGAQGVNTTNMGIYGNPRGYQPNKITYFPAIIMGANYWITPKIAFNFGMTGTGYGTEYGQSPINPLLLNPPGGDFNNKISNKAAVLVPGLVYKYSDRQAYSISLLLGYAELYSNIAASPSLTETTGGNKKDTAIGTGVRLGGLWDIFPAFSIGAQASSAVQFSKFKKYADIAPYRNALPPNIGVGVKISPINVLDLMLDYKRIIYSSEPIYKEGNHYQNMNVYIASLQYKPTDVLKIFLGYNYGKNPIETRYAISSMYNPNQLLEHHFTVGTLYDITHKLSLSGSFQYAVPVKITGNASSGIANGMVADLRKEYLVWLGLVWKL